MLVSRNCLRQDRYSDASPRSPSTFRNMPAQTVEHHSTWQGELRELFAGADKDVLEMSDVHRFNSIESLGAKRGIDDIVEERPESLEASGGELPVDGPEFRKSSFPAALQRHSDNVFLLKEVRTLLLQGVPKSDEHLACGVGRHVA